MKLKTTLSLGAIALAVTSVYAVPQILDFTGLNVTISTGSGFYIDVDNSGGASELSGQFVSGSLGGLTFSSDHDLSISINPSENVDFTATYSQVTTATGSGYVDLLGSGVDVNYNTSPVTGGNTALELDNAGVWQGLQAIGYAGFAFNNGSNIYNGWVEIFYYDDINYIEIYRIGWETTPDATITTPVPEPSSTALLAGVLASFAAARRRTR